jgi:hypothetical protein
MLKLKAIIIIITIRRRRRRGGGGIYLHVKGRSAPVLN